MTNLSLIYMGYYLKQGDAHKMESDEPALSIGVHPEISLEQDTNVGDA